MKSSPRFRALRAAAWAAVTAAGFTWTAVVGAPGDQGFHSTSAAPTETLELREGLAVASVASSARSAIRTDAVEAMVVAGTWRTPTEGDTVILPDGAVQKWALVKAGDDGWLKHDALRGGYLVWTFNCDTDRPAILEARGHAMVYVNGEPRAGDPYELGFVGLPVALKAGVNELLFKAGRGRIHAKLIAPASPVIIDTRDLTQGDVIAGESATWLGATVIINTTDKPLVGWTTRVNGPDDPTNVPMPRIEPMSARKVTFRESGRWETPGDSKVTLEVLDATGDVAASAPANITVLPADTHATGRTRRVAFHSQIDGSVQYYALREPLRPGPTAAPTTDSPQPDSSRPGLLLTLHGASVEAKGQVDSYAPKDWCFIVGPTNRRPFGFDWEDWGRLDALEVLDLARQTLKPDPSRIWLTGHSMGGHGTWQIAGTFPDLFAAAAPSAGWPTFWTYSAAGTAPPWEFEPKGGIAELMGRAVRSSDTLGLVSNYALLGSAAANGGGGGGGGVYILHGDADDNVPVAQARLMRDRLTADGQTVGYHEQPGAGHWWGNDVQGGCVDWTPIMDLFRGRTLPRIGDVVRVRFTTMNPSVSSRAYWAHVMTHAARLTPSSIDLSWDKSARSIVGTTSNVALLRVDIGLLGGLARIELDGQTIDLESMATSATVLLLARHDNRWRILHKREAAAAVAQLDHRVGPFKSVLQNRMAFVYGTRGTDTERASMFAKARYDAETFWYRGNGSVDILSDTEFSLLSDEYRGRNLVLFGNRDLNGAWATVVGSSPVDVAGGRVTIGSRAEQGDDLACLFVGRRADGEGAFAAVGGTGLKGLRLTERMAYFLSGLGFPDVSVFGPEFLEKGIDGIRTAGYLGPDGGLEHAEIAWRDPPP